MFFAKKIVHAYFSHIKRIAHASFHHATLKEYFFSLPYIYIDIDTLSI